MNITVVVPVNASRERVWDIVTDFDNIAENISAVTESKVLERPESGLIGLKWQETRILFGKESTETMWISAVNDGYWYETEAYNCGSVYNSKIELQEQDGGTQLSMSFAANPKTISAKLFSVLSFMFNRAIEKAFREDLQDLKHLAENP